MIRKEMKKAKAHMVKVTKAYPKRLVIEAEMPYEVYIALKNKLSFASNRHNLTSYYKEWNECKIKHISMDPDKVFATLDEHSKKLFEFGDHYGKDSLQMFSKLKVVIPKGYEYIFTLLNTEEEHNKRTDL